MRHIIRPVVAVLAVSLCLGCTPIETQQSSREVSVLKIIKPNYIPEFSKIVNDFNEINTDIQIKFVDAPSATGDRHQLYVSALSGHDDSIDIYWINDEWIKEFAQKNYIAPLDKQVTLDNSRYVIDAQERFSYDDSLYALPIGLDMDFLFYRGDYIQTLPSNWESIINICRTSESDIPLKLSLENDDALDTMFNLIQMKNAMNSTYADVLGTYKEIVSDSDTEDVSSVDGIATFKTGGALMLMGKGALWNKFNSSTSAVRDTVKISMLPSSEGSEALICGYGMAINANSKNQDAAVRFLDYMNSKDVQQRLSRDCSVMPIIEELYSDAMIADENPYMKDLKDIVKSSKSYGSAGIEGERLKKLEEVLIKYFAGEETANNAGEMIESLLQ